MLGKTLVGFTALDPHWQIPFIQQASASIERQIGGTMVVEVGYTGAWGRNLDRAHLVNNAAPSPLPLGPRRPYQTISFVEGTVLPDTWPIASMTFPVGPDQPARVHGDARTTTPGTSRRSGASPTG